MRILLISYWFPPDGAVGAFRVGKLATYLHRAGHELRVLAGPESRAEPLKGTIQVVRTAGAPSNVPQSASKSARLRDRGPIGRALRNHYHALVQIPDARKAWRRSALQAAETLLQAWRPDLILVSAPPRTGLLVARTLSRRGHVPFVAELRDPWAADPYSVVPFWRAWLDIWLERQVLRDAAGLVAVSPVVAERLARCHRRPVVTVMNGYSPEDLPPPGNRDGGEKLRIVHAGGLYEGRRDPSPLFEALARCGEARTRIEVLFLGPSAEEVLPLAARHGVEACVRVGAPVSHDKALVITAAADVLLLLQRNHPGDAGNIPAKFFEYLGVRRPILMLGCETGVVAAMIRARGAGRVSNDPDTIARQLMIWLETLPSGPPALPETARAGLARDEQFAQYLAFLGSLVPDCPPARQNPLLSPELDGRDQQQHEYQASP
jgi:glycosyltransferase involved in cell wall biosynthesis